MSHYKRYTTSKPSVSEDDDMRALDSSFRIATFDVISTAPPLLDVEAAGGGKLCSLRLLSRR
jgi:hypothetical protein